MKYFTIVRFLNISGGLDVEVSKIFFENAPKYKKSNTKSIDVYSRTNRKSKGHAFKASLFFI